MEKPSQFLNSGSAEGREYLAAESAELSLAFCGYEVCAPGTQYPPGQCSHYTLFCIQSGKGCCTVDGRHWDLEEQDMMLIYPGSEYAFSADPQEGCRCMGIVFTGVRAEDYLLYAGFSREQPHRRSLCLHQMEPILNQVLTSQVRTADLLRANGYLKVFLGDLIEEHSARGSGKDLSQIRAPKTSEHVKNAIDYISKHYPEDVKIQELADFVGINRSYLASSFKKATGRSPKEYLLGLRMEKAKQLLETTQMPISSISAAVGYEDPLAFSRIFKRYSGLSPTDYRDEKKSNF